MQTVSAKQVARAMLSAGSMLNVSRLLFVKDSIIVVATVTICIIAASSGVYFATLSLQLTEWLSWHYLHPSHATDNTNLIRLQVVS